MDSPLRWEEVSLYRNPFNEVIATTTFDGSLSSSTFSSTSPEFSTDGQYAKCWMQEGDTIWLYKTGGIFGDVHSGRPDFEQDRHSGNFGALYQNDTMQIQKMAPVFDNNRSLLFDLDDDQLKHTDWCIHHCSPRLGVDFIATARGLMTDAIRSDLKNLQSFRFEQHPSISASQQRLDLLTEIVQRQLRDTLT